MRRGSAPTGSSTLVAVSGLLLCLVVAVGVAVGVYAIRNPNGFDFGPWPMASEVFAAIAALTLGLSTRAQWREPDRRLAAVGVSAATVALLMLGDGAVRVELQPALSGGVPLAAAADVGKGR